MIHHQRQWLARAICTIGAATTLFACAMPVQVTDSGRDTGRDTAVADVQRPDVQMPIDTGVCASGETLCGPTCVNLDTSATNCGACGRACAAGETCTMGACRGTTMCTGTQTNCSGTCVDTQSDANNCGACGMACPMGQSCAMGMCRPAVMCPMGQTDCGGMCVDTRTSATNCGMCGTSCPAGQTCMMGACAAPMCTGSETLCGGRCVNTQTDGMNCGACGNVCPMGQTCTAGACVNTMVMCTAPEVNCGGRCVNTQTSATNCGVCGRACAMGQTCSAGMCMGTVVCPMGQMVCGSACADLQTDPINCGACGTMCPAGQTCSMGRCVMGRPMCPAGQTDCAPMAPAPNCVDLQSSMANCGACGTVCGAGQTCSAGRCACGAGQMLCGRVCVNTTSDNNNCGACGRVCGAGTTCQSGMCRCPTGQTGCGTPSVCVDLQSSAANCGACGTACPTGQSCVAGRCACPMGQMACGTPSTCVNTQTDRNNCGMCGRVCAMGQTCTAGVCACPMGQTACAGVCVDLQTSAANCGACGMACPMGTACTAGRCMGTPPANDTRAGATLINLAMPSQTIAANTTSARHDTNGTCGCTTTGNDVFYRFVLTVPEIVYADTLGATWDTSLFIQDAAGNNVTASAGFTTCNDDARDCGLTTGLQSMVVARLPAGTYFLVLSGCSAGMANIKFQHLPAGNGTSSRIAPDGTVRQAMSTTSGTGTTTSTCCSGSPENSLWWLTCPSSAANTFNANTCNAMTGATTAAYDVSLTQASALRSGAVCNDDVGGGFVCGSGSNVNASIPATAANQVGLNTLVVDGCSGSGAATVNYVMATCATGTRCGAICADTLNDNNNCGGCARRCNAGTACSGGVCVAAPSNDRPAGAVVINMANPQSTFTVNTVAAVNDTSGSCGCTAGEDVFYNFTLTAPEIVYADTIGSTRDTSIFIQTSTGTNVASAGLPNGATCNDDGGLAGCATGTQSQIMAQLPAGAYRLVVSGCGAGGPTNIRFQHLPVGNGAVAALAAGSSTPAGTTSGTGRITSTCCSTGPENTYYWYTCGAAMGGSFTASTCGRATWDTELAQRSAARAPTEVCNDDVSGTCGARSSITSMIPAGAGIHTLYVDGCLSQSGAYSVSVSRP
jgi:hypothetical protein